MTASPFAVRARSASTPLRFLEGSAPSAGPSSFPKRTIEHRFVADGNTPAKKSRYTVDNPVRNVAPGMDNQRGRGFYLRFAGNPHMGKVAILEPTTSTRKQWAKKIAASWKLACSSSIEAFFQTGQELLAAKDDLDHGEWLKMVESDLPFGRHTARKLMGIARDPELGKRAYKLLLPPDYNTIYQVQRLHHRFPETFRRMVDDGRISPALRQNEINLVLRLETVAKDIKRIESLVARQGKFRTLVVDPPWDYEWLSVGGASKPGYATMTHEQLLAFNLGQWMEDDCHVYQWTTNNFIGRASELMVAWGVQHKTVLTWIKTDKQGDPRIGLGTYFRNTTEHVLFGMRGKLRTRVNDVPTHFFASVGKHSEKPEEFYDIVRRASFTPAGEAFQRKPRPDFENLFEEALPATAAAE